MKIFNKAIVSIFISLFVISSGSVLLSQQVSGPSAKTEINTEIERAIRDSQELIEYRAQDLRDPFGYLISFEEEAEEEGPLDFEEGVEVPTLSVEGMIWGGKIPLAIINEQVVGVGDTIEGFKVLKIEKQGVTLLRKGKAYIVKPSF